MSEKKEDNNNIWVFPEVSKGSSDDDDDDFCEEFSSIDDELKLPVHPTHEELSATKADEAAAELDALKGFYEQKIISVSKIITKLNDTKLLIDEEILKHIVTLVKKISKRIIKKEIQLDPAILKEMINELKGKITTPGAVVTVQLCKADFDRLENLKPEMEGFFKVQNELKEGDIVLKCTTSEIHAQLNDRIESLLGEVND